jgi:hypothetical protein
MGTLSIYVTPPFYRLFLSTAFELVDNANHDRQLWLGKKVSPTLAAASIFQHVSSPEV